jgi:hypothetical protein
VSSPNKRTWLSLAIRAHEFEVEAQHQAREASAAVANMAAAQYENARDDSRAVIESWRGYRATATVNQTVELSYCSYSAHADDVEARCLSASESARIDLDLQEQKLLCAFNRVDALTALQDKRNDREAVHELRKQQRALHELVSIRAMPAPVQLETPNEA